MERLPDDLAHAYLDLLGVRARPARVDGDALATLQHAHLERVPYETLDIVRRSAPDIDPVACARRVVGGRGGYCYHLNGAFAALLAWLGVDVTRHVAGVQGHAVAEPPGANGNHLGLTVRTPDGRRWLVDVGLGDGPAEPLPLVAGVHEEGGYRYELHPSVLAPGGWRFEHDARGGFIGFDMSPHSATTRDFAGMHSKLTADSGFTRVVIVQRRVDQRLEILRGCVYTEIDADGAQSSDVTDPDSWWELVLGHFGLAYGDLEETEREALWRRVLDGHAAWDAAGRP